MEGFLEEGVLTHGRRGEQNDARRAMGQKPNGESQMMERLINLFKVFGFFLTISLVNIHPYA